MAFTSDPTPAGLDDPADHEALETYARELGDAIDAALPAWVERVVRERMAAAGRPVGDEVVAAARRAGVEARQEGGAAVRVLLGRDVDDQPTGPLEVLRRAARYPTAVLAEAGVEAVDRDDVARRIHPDDVYDLGPASFADVGPEVQGPGIAWGAAKAHIILARRRREGRR